MVVAFTILLISALPSRLRRSDVLLSYLFKSHFHLLVNLICQYFVSKKKHHYDNLNKKSTRTKIFSEQSIYKLKQNILIRGAYESENIDKIVSVVDCDGIERLRSYRTQAIACTGGHLFINRVVTAIANTC